MIKKIGALLFIFILFLFSSFAQAETNPNCYLVIENPDKIEPQIVENLSVSLISKYIDKISSIPSSGIGADECFYQISIKKSEETLLVTIVSQKVNGIGESKLAGIDGIQQAILKAIFNSYKEKRGEICQDFGKKIEKDCKYFASTPVLRVPLIDRPVFTETTGTLQKGICSVLQSHRSYTHCNLEKKRFKNLELEEADFSGIDLSKIHFINSRFTNVLFKGSNLEKAIFTESTFTGVVFDSANMDKVGFNKAELSHSSFSKTNLERANFEGASLNQLIMNETNLQRADFRKANLNQVDMSGSNLERADFNGAILNQVNLTNANLEKVDMGKATLNDVIR